MLVERRGQVTDVGSEPTGNGRSFKILDGRRQPSCGGTSRMMREYHVRICERLGVKFPGPTRQRWSKSSRQDLEQVGIRKTNESEPIEDASLRSSALGDKGYDSKSNRKAARQRGICPAIPYRSNTKDMPAFFPKALYKARARIEQAVGKLSASSVSPFDVRRRRRIMARSSRLLSVSS
jgi:hypothetical protein